MDHKELPAVLCDVNWSGDVEAIPRDPEVYRRSAPGVRGDEPDEIPGTNLRLCPHVVEPQPSHVGLAFLGFAHPRHHLQGMVGAPGDRLNHPCVERASLSLDPRKALRLSLALLLRIYRRSLVAGSRSDRCSGSRSDRCGGSRSDRRGGSGLLPFVGDCELLRLRVRLKVKVLKVVIALKLGRSLVFGNLGRWFHVLPGPLPGLRLHRDGRAIDIVASNRHTRDGFAVRNVFLDVPEQLQDVPVAFDVAQPDSRTRRRYGLPSQ
mmetsp:Transcript_6155/g.27129  ORF Transcript_6155/g.27129 Transcript_6155/m.27129 type:complete len:264 (-) Transcript_6155:720-1511(-)